MRDIHAAAQACDVPALMRLLKADTIEAPGTAAAVVADRWMALSSQDRARTGIYASGRQLRAATNGEVQQRRMAAGELGCTPAEFGMLSPVHLTREEQRLCDQHPCREGATSDLGIVAADSREGRLITASLLRVLATRMREGVTLVVDDGRRLEKVAGRQAGEEMAASDVPGQGSARTSTGIPIRLPDPPPRDAEAIASYARAFIAV